MNNNKSVYEVDCLDVTTEKIIGKRIAENILSRVESDRHHYQLLNEVTSHKRDYSAITNFNGLIKSSNGNLNTKGQLSDGRYWLDGRMIQLIRFP